MGMIGVKRPGIQHLGKARHVTRLHLRQAILVSRLGILAGDRPVGVGGARDPLDALKHVILTDHKALHIHAPVDERRQRQAVIVLVCGQLLETENLGHGAPNLRQRRRRHLGVAIVIDRQGPPVEVKPEARLPAPQAVLVPEPAAHGDPLHAEPLDLVPVGLGQGPHQGVFAEFGVVHVAAIPVRHDVGNTGFGCRLNELAVGVAGCGRGHGYDQDLLVVESGDEGGLVIVVDGGDSDALGESVAALFARERCDGVLSGLEKGIGNMPSNGASSLGYFHSLDGVGEADGLIFGVLGHCGNVSIAAVMVE